MFREHLSGLTVWECSGCKSFRESLRRGHTLNVFWYVFVPRMKIKEKIKKFPDECYYKYWKSFGVNNADACPVPSDLI